MLKSFARLISKNLFVRQISILTSGTIFAQGLTFLALPLLTRLYAPEDFNLLAVYIAIVGILSAVASLRFNIAIPLPVEEKDAINLLALSVIIPAALSILLAAAILTMPQAIASVLRQPEIQPLLWMLPIGVFLASVYNALQYWATRRQKFGLITKTRMTRAVGGIGIQTGFGLTSPGPFGLVFGHMIYGGLGIFGLIKAFWKKDRNLLANINGNSLLSTWRKYSEFPKRSTPAVLFDAGYQHAPILILAATLTDTLMGIVFIAMRIMVTPVSLVGAAISQAYLAHARERLSTKTLGSFTRRNMQVLFTIGAPLLICIGIGCYAGFGFIFGEAYTAAGTIILWMLPWFITQLVASPVSPIYVATAHQGHWLLLQIMGFCLIVGSCLYAALLYPKFIIEFYVIANAFFYGIMIFVTMYLSYKIDREV